MRSGIYSRLDFNRDSSDLLRRHLANRAVHGLRDPETIAKSRRVLKACRRCASKKLKCDGDHPCSRCRKPGHECIYETAQQRQGSAFTPASVSASGSTDEDTVASQYAPRLMNPILPSNDDHAQPFAFRDARITNHLSPTSPDTQSGQAFAPVSLSALDGHLDGETIDEDSLRLGLTAFDLPFVDGQDIDIAQMDAFIRNAFNESGFDDDGTLEMPREFHTAPLPSPWQWSPQQTDFSTTATSVVGLSGSQQSSRPSEVVQYFDEEARDNLLAAVIDSLPPQERVQRGIPSLPSASVLNDLVHFSILQQSYCIDSWMTTQFDKEDCFWCVTVCGLAANGAIHSSVPSVVRFGYALHEVVRMKVKSILDGDSGRTQDPAMLRAQAYNLGIGLWSGYSRSMDTCESYLMQTLILLRKSGNFQAGYEYQVHLSEETDGTELYRQWRNFRAVECRKRTNMHLFIEQAQCSMTFYMPPNISISELNISLPLRRDLWDVKCAATWRDAWTQMLVEGDSVNGIRIPTLSECIADLSNLMRMPQYVDLPFAALAVLHGFWLLTHQQRELTIISNLASSSHASEPAESSVPCLLRSFEEHIIPAIPEESGSLPIIRLHHALLHVQHYSRIPLIQNFAGRFGPAAARNARVELMRWYKSSSARSAARWAAVVLRAAEQVPRGALRDFSAVAVYHASLVIWAYGVFDRHESAMNRVRTNTQQRYHEAPSTLLGASRSGGSALVLLDVACHEDVHGFIATGHGSPCIMARPYSTATMASEEMSIVRLSDPASAMEICRDILEANHQCSPRHDTALPMLVENLVKLVNDLGKAAARRFGTG